MLLKSLSIKDFRQFKGEQTIVFSTDSEQNVTMIMGNNGTGKTTLAQVFTWCLHGETSFDDKILLCKATSAKMFPNSQESVRAELSLEHNGVDYTIITEEKYKKDSNGSIKPIGQLVRTIAFKRPDGTRNYVNQLDTEIRIKEILPKELAKYFFFDGERIDKMSKEIKRGRSQEFAGAVRSLLGLSAYTSALSHLKGRSSSTVIKLYEDNYDATNNVKIADYGRQIKDLNNKIEDIDQHFNEIEEEKAIANDHCLELTERIAKNKDSEKLASQKAALLKKKDVLLNSKISRTTNLLRFFNNGASSFFAKKLMKDALSELSKAEKLDKGIPFINDKTILHLLEHKKCICGTDIVAGNEAFVVLTKLLDYIPPKSIGNMIGEFVFACENKSHSVENFYDEFCDNYKYILEIDDNKIEIENDIQSIEKQLVGLESVGGLQAELSRYENQVKKHDSDRDAMNLQKGGFITKIKELEAARQELANRDENNRKIEIYKAYAQYMHDVLLEQYSTEEAKIREELQNTVNELFRNIYNGGFSLSLDDKYNVQINVIDQAFGFEEDVETSTAQSISVIFAFIAGVIKMARNSQKAENKMLVSEAYPLVMDAPLSAFDKTRIKTVCEVLPVVAEQVIIFIKDTDGDLADQNLKSKVGKHYVFEKKSEFEVYIV